MKIPQLIDEIEMRRPVFSHGLQVEQVDEFSLNLRDPDTDFVVNSISTQHDFLQTLSCPRIKQVIGKVQHHWHGDTLVNVTVSYVEMVDHVLKWNLNEGYGTADALLKFWRDNRFGYTRCYVGGDKIHLHQVYRYHQDDHPQHFIVSINDDVVHYPDWVISRSWELHKRFLGAIAGNESLPGLTRQAIDENSDIEENGDA